LKALEQQSLGLYLNPRAHSTNLRNNDLGDHGKLTEQTAKNFNPLLFQDHEWKTQKATCELCSYENRTIPHL